MIPWEIYGIITHDPSSHVNLPLGLPCNVTDPCINKSTSDIIIIRRKRNKKTTLPTLTHGAMQGFGLTSTVVCTNGKKCDRRERNMTIRSEI
jgi:hypothetical protein